MRVSKSAATLGSRPSPRGRYNIHPERSPTFASHSLHGGTPDNWLDGRCIACAKGLVHSSREAAVQAKQLLVLEAQLEAERGAKAKAVAMARSDAERGELGEREREDRARGSARSVQLSESVQLFSFPSESAARQAALDGCVPCRSPSPSARREQAEAEEEELRVTRAAQERKRVQLSEGKLSDQLEVALASALSELKEARAELRKQRELSEESKSAAEGARQESLRLQRRCSGAEAEAEELREQLRAAQAEGQSLRLRCTAAEEELTARGSAARIATRTQQARRRAHPTRSAPHTLRRPHAACAPHAHARSCPTTTPRNRHPSPQLLVRGACPRSSPVTSPRCVHAAPTRHPRGTHAAPTRHPRGTHGMHTHVHAHTYSHTHEQTHVPAACTPHVHIACACRMCAVRVCCAGRGGGEKGGGHTLEAGGEA